MSKSNKQLLLFIGSYVVGQMISRAIAVRALQNYAKGH